MNKKTIWITGGSTGIGKALAIKFANKGWNVAVSARREELLNELSNQYENISAFPLDVTDKQKCAEVFEQIKNKYQDVQLLSYAVKYASNFYGPFRDAVGSKKTLKSDKKNYQMDFANINEAYREVALDIKEGADMVMVKPGMPYLDIIKSIKDNFKIPVLAYQVSGEYSMIKQSINNNLINEDSIIESLMCFKRAGASAIVSYFALDIAKKL